MFADKSLPLQDYYIRLGRHFGGIPGAITGAAIKAAAERMGFKVGSKFETLKALNREEPLLKAEIATANNELTPRQTHLKPLIQERSRLESLSSRNPVQDARLLALDGQINSLQQEISDLHETINDKQAKLDQKAALENEKHDATERMKTLQTELTTEEAKLKTAEVNFQQKETAAQNLDKSRKIIETEFRDERAGAELDTVNAFEGVIGKATDEWLQSEYSQLIQTYSADLEDAKLKTTNDDEKAMYDAISDRWLDSERGRRKGLLWLREERYRPIDRHKVDRDFQTLMRPDVHGKTDGGPEQVMRSVLREHYGRTMAGNALGRVVHGGEINAKVETLMNNKDFTDKMRPTLVKNLLARKLMTGGISPEDTYTIVTAQWGQDMVDQALATNQQFKDALDKMNKQGALSRHTGMQRWAQHVYKFPLSILLLTVPSIIGGMKMTPEEEQIHW